MESEKKRRKVGGKSDDIVQSPLKSLRLSVVKKIEVDTIYKKFANVSDGILSCGNDNELKVKEILKCSVSGDGELHSCMKKMKYKELLRIYRDYLPKKRATLPSNISKLNLIAEIVAIFYGVKTHVEKRELEDENMIDLGNFEEEYRFVKFGNIEVPNDIIISTLSYLEYNMSILKNIGSVCKCFYVTILSSWTSIKVDHDNLRKISLLVLRRVKEIEVKTNSFPKQDQRYLISQIERIRSLKLSLRKDIFVDFCQTLIKYRRKRYNKEGKLKKLEQSEQFTSFFGVKKSSRMKKANPNSTSSYPSFYPFRNLKELELNIFQKFYNERYPSKYGGKVLNLRLIFPNLEVVKGILSEFDIMSTRKSIKYLREIELERFDPNMFEYLPKLKSQSLRRLTIRRMIRDKYDRWPNVQCENPFRTFLQLFPNLQELKLHFVDSYGIDFPEKKYSSMQEEAEEEYHPKTFVDTVLDLRLFNSSNFPELRRLEIHEEEDKNSWMWYNFKKKKSKKVIMMDDSNNNNIRSLKFYSSIKEGDVFDLNFEDLLLLNPSENFFMTFKNNSSSEERKTLHLKCCILSRRRAGISHLFRINNTNVPNQRVSKNTERMEKNQREVELRNQVEKNEMKQLISTVVLEYVSTVTHKSFLDEHFEDFETIIATRDDWFHKESFSAKYRRFSGQYGCRRLEFRYYDHSRNLHRDISSSSSTTEDPKDLAFSHEKFMNKIMGEDCDRNQDLGETARRPCLSIFGMIVKKILREEEKPGLYFDVLRIHILVMKEFMLCGLGGEGAGCTRYKRIECYQDQIDFWKSYLVGEGKQGFEVAVEQVENHLYIEYVRS